MAQFRSVPFGILKNGDKVNEYILSNPGGLEVHILNYGCVIKNILVPTKHGPVDVVLVTHDHADHVGDAVAICKHTGAMLGAIVGTAQKL